VRVFPRAALEALREPLESGQITISRAARQAAFPARFQLAAAMNPCPCGYLGAFAATGKTCRCTPDAIARYQSRLSGPLLDRIDLQVELPAIKPAQLMAEPDGESSAQVGARVCAARERQQRRQGLPNASIEPGQFDALCVMDEAAAHFVQTAAQRLGWSGRSLRRALKVARTIADLAQAERIGSTRVAEAVQYRRSLLSP
jgi:magnesium chelatase family protein